MSVLVSVGRVVVWSKVGARIGRSRLGRRNPAPELAGKTMVERWRRAPAVKWFKEVKALCEASGHWAIAQQMIGKALMCRPDGMGIWDPWFVAHEGQVHLFHLQKRAGSNRIDAEADHIGHATSRDLIR